MAGNRIRFNTSSNKCPVCNGASPKCSKNIDTKVVHCRGGTENAAPYGWRYIGLDAQGFAMHIHEDDDERRQRPNAKPKPKLPAWADDIIKHAVPIDDTGHSIKTPLASPTPAVANHVGDDYNRDRTIYKLMLKQPKPFVGDTLDDFSADIGLPLGFFRGVQYVYAYNKHSMGYLLRDGDGTIVGGKLRWLKADTPPDRSNKHNLVRSGLVYDDGFEQLDGPILCPEGKTDHMVLAALGVATVARDSSRAGADHLVRLFRRLNIDAGRRIIVLGENDAHVNRRGVFQWEGRDGALAVAQKLADALGFPVFVAMSPDGSKDALDWYKCQDDAGDLAGLRQRLLDAVSDSANLTQVDPAPPEPLPEGVPLEESTAFNRVGSEMREGLGECDERLEDAQMSPSLLASPGRLLDCPNCKKIVLAHIDPATRQAKVIFPPCRSIECPVCGERRREQWAESIRHHLREYGRRHVGRLVYVYAVDRGREWRNVVSDMAYKRRKARLATSEAGRHVQADYIKLTLLHCAKDIVVSTQPPPTSIEGVDAVLPSVAIERLTFEVPRIPAVQIKHLYSSSRAWGMLKDPRRKMPPKWKRIGDIDGTLQGIFEVIEERGLRLKAVHNNDHWWPKKGYVVFLKPSGLTAEHLCMELSAGETFPIGIKSWSSGGPIEPGGASRAADLDFDDLVAQFAGTASREPGDPRDDIVFRIGAGT